MNKEFFEALALLEKEKGVPMNYLLEKIKAAIVIAVKRDYGQNANIIVDIDPETAKFKVAIVKTVVENVENPETEMTLDEAKTYSKRAVMGDNVEIKLETKQFGRIAAQTAKQVIRQGIKEAEREHISMKFRAKEHELVTAEVTRTDIRHGNVIVKIDNSEILLPKSEQVPTEKLEDGDIIKVYVVDASDPTREPKISRTHPGLVKRLFELEVPEVYDGTVEIKSIAREPGSRTKIAVMSHDENVDAVGACIGHRGSRVEVVVSELNDEKIDVVKYSDDPAEFIKAALSPSEIIRVDIVDEENRACRVVVPDDQLSLAIGNKGQNARLAAKLTGWKIDIKPLSAFGE
ncbi:MAG TPA: transcription termination/antitermination protein NusA [Ruminococcaceae bacterium]|nr:transcription termination/antitermination protein NusA [Oscillospiraceae bacterium]